MNIVLHQPEIPHNTGAIGRTCLMTGTKLHLIRPYGFYLDEKSLKRSGLDYWHKLNVREYDSFSQFIETAEPASSPGHEGLSHTRFFLVETGGELTYADVKYQPDDYIIFGSETTGLPPWLLEQYAGRIISIPMTGEERSLNLSVAAGIVLYEALRQNGFANLSTNQ